MMTQLNLNEIRNTKVGNGDTVANFGGYFRELCQSTTKVGNGDTVANFGGYFRELCQSTIVEPQKRNTNIGNGNTADNFGKYGDFHSPGTGLLQEKH